MKPGRNGSVCLAAIALTSDPHTPPDKPPRTSSPTDPNPAAPGRLSTRLTTAVHRQQISASAADPTPRLTLTPRESRSTVEKCPFRAHAQRSASVGQRSRDRRCRPLCGTVKDTVPHPVQNHQFWVKRPVPPPRRHGQAPTLIASTKCAPSSKATRPDVINSKGLAQSRRGEFGASPLIRKEANYAMRLSICSSVASM